MSVIQLTAQAEDGLVDIWIYIAHDDPDTADRVTTTVASPLPRRIRPRSQSVIGVAAEVAQEIRPVALKLVPGSVTLAIGHIACGRRRLDEILCGHPGARLKDAPVAAPGSSIPDLRVARQPD